MGSKNRPPRKLPDRTVHSTLAAGLVRLAATQQQPSWLVPGMTTGPQCPCGLAPRARVLSRCQCSNFVVSRNFEGPASFKFEQGVVCQLASTAAAPGPGCEPSAGCIYCAQQLDVGRGRARRGRSRGRSAPFSIKFAARSWGVEPARGQRTNWVDCR